MFQFISHSELSWLELKSFYRERESIFMGPNIDEANGLWTEVDFQIADKNEPMLLIETKLSDSQPSAVLLKFQSALKVPAVQLTNRTSV